MQNNNTIILNYALNIEMLHDRLKSVDESINKLKDLQNTNKEIFLQDNSTEQYAVRAALHMTLQALLDIAGHLLTRIPGTKSSIYRQNIVELGKKGVISKEFLPTAEQIAGYRGRLIHYYIDIEPQELYDILQNKIPDIIEFKRQLASFIDLHKDDKKFIMQK